MTFIGKANHTPTQPHTCSPFRSQLTTDHIFLIPLIFRYYGGEKTAPIPTVFIGGNHEASNYLQELPYGGWVAPNIYFLNTGIIRFGPLRIGGVSGIFKVFLNLLHPWDRDDEMELEEVKLMPFLFLYMYVGP